MIYREQENYTAAVETFRKMLPLGDENARTGYQDIIDTYREAKQWPQATAVAKEAVQKMPNDRDLRMVLDAQLADTGDPDTAARRCALHAERTARRSRRLHSASPSCTPASSAGADAEEALDKAEQLSTKPEDKDYVYFLRGRLYEREKKYDQAEAAVQEVLAIDPQSACHPQLSRLHECRSRREARRVAQLHQAGLSLEPNNGAYLDSLGWAYFKLGKYDLAEENLNKAVLHMGSDPTVQEHLGDLYQKTGRLKLAAAHWERAVEEWNKTVAAGSG